MQNYQLLFSMNPNLVKNQLPWMVLLLKVVAGKLGADNSIFFCQIQQTYQQTNERLSSASTDFSK